MALAYASRNGYLGIVKEATYGTTPTTGVSFIPVADDVAITLGQKFLANESLVGSPVMTIDEVQGVRSDDITFKCGIYADTFPLLLVAALGGTDSVTGAGPYTHVIKLLNSASTGSQPPSFSIMLFDGANYWTMAGCRLDSLEIPFSSDGTVDATSKFIGNPATSGTSAPTGFASPTFSSEVMIPGWSVSATINSVSIPYINSGTLTIARNTAAIFTEGSQSSYDNFAGPIKVTGKMTAIVASQSDPWSAASPAQALTRDQIATVLTFTDPNDVTSATDHSVSFTMTKTQYMNPKRSQGKLYVEVDADFEAVSNSTDASSGVSPIQSTTINNTSTAYN
jgi:hypothetical protein